MKTPFRLSRIHLMREITAVKKILNNREKLTYGKYVKKLEKK